MWSVFVRPLLKPCEGLGPSQCATFLSFRELHGQAGGLQCERAPNHQYLITKASSCPHFLPPACDGMSAPWGGAACLLSWRPSQDLRQIVCLHSQSSMLRVCVESCHRRLLCQPESGKMPLMRIVHNRSVLAPTAMWDRFLVLWVHALRMVGSCKDHEWKAQVTECLHAPESLESSGALKHLGVPIGSPQPLTRAA